MSEDSGTNRLDPLPNNLAVSRYDYAVLSIERLRARLPSGLIYDIGAGDGRLRKPIESIGFHWCGFDLSPATPGVLRWDLNTKAPLISPSPGGALLLDVIEHLVNPGMALANVFEALAPNGMLVLTTPNPRWSRTRLHALLTGYLSNFTLSDLELNHHVFPAWPHILMQMLRSVGFEVEEYVTLDGRTAWPGRPLTLRYPLRCLHASVSMMIERLDPSASGMSYGLIARAAK